MNNQSDSTGILRIVDGIKSDEKALAIKAGLADLPGVYGIRFAGDAVRILCDRGIATEFQFYNAVKTAGFRACEFHWAA